MSSLTLSVCPNKLAAFVNLYDKDGWASLHSAGLNGHIKVVQALLESGADIDIANDNGDTCLHLAALRGYKAIVKLLLDRGADINVLNNSGKTPLQI
jgi:ankyrin repeat protein